MGPVILLPEWLRRIAFIIVLQAAGVSQELPRAKAQSKGCSCSCEKLMHHTKQCDGGTQKQGEAALTPQLQTGGFQF